MADARHSASPPRSPLCPSCSAASHGFGGVLGHKVDHVLSRIVDTLMAMPVLIFALMILSVLGTSMPVLIGTIAILDSTRVFRLARLVAQGIAVQEYVEAAR